MKTISEVLTETPNATDAEIIAAIEASRAWRRVPIQDVTIWLLENNLLGTLEEVRDTTQSQPLRVGLSEFLRGLDLYASLDATSASVLAKAQTLTGALAQAGVITSDQLASFASLLKEPIGNLQGQIDQHRRGLLVQSDIDAAAQATDDAQAFIAAAREWQRTGEGTRPTR